MKDQCSIYRHPHKILTPTHHQGKQTDACKAAQKRAGETGQQGKHAQVIGAVTADHKTGKGLTETLEKIHG